MVDDGPPVAVAGKRGKRTGRGSNWPCYARKDLNANKGSYSGWDRKKKRCGKGAAPLSFFLKKKSSRLRTARDRGPSSKSVELWQSETAALLGSAPWLSAFRKNFSFPRTEVKL